MIMGLISYIRARILEVYWGAKFLLVPTAVVF